MISIGERPGERIMDEQMVEQTTEQFFRRNYNYLWLRAMLERCAEMPAGSTLITGSSYALSGIQECVWKNAVNCSMHSQDIYYDFLCARRAILSAGNRHFDKCFIITGYYGAYHDLSSGKLSRESMIGIVYYPIFQDAHNWAITSHGSPWDVIGGTPDHIKPICEQIAVRRMQEYGTYYAKRSRRPVFDLRGETWSQITEEERTELGKARAGDHNKLLQHKASREENGAIFQAFVHFLHQHDVHPIVVIPPFTREYNRSILPEMKKEMLELLNAVPEAVSYVDLNQQADLFEPADFVDTDHLSASGAEKVSHILVEKFGA